MVISSPKIVGSMDSQPPSVVLQRSLLRWRDLAPFRSETFGIVLEPLMRRWMEIRTSIIKSTNLRVIEKSLPSVCMFPTKHFVTLFLDFCRDIECNSPSWIKYQLTFHIKSMIFCSRFLTDSVEKENTNYLYIPRIFF